MAAGRLVYLDTSAFVKLVRAEPETTALVASLRGAERLVASEILEVEALCAVRRARASLLRARAQLAGVRLLPLSAELRARSLALDPPGLRSLDAIRLAAALSIAERLHCLYTYDERLGAAARKAGLMVQTPA
ncbi:MAG TPA: type II toxin-antitoxin system VapC family toxin [Solirubrobacteraceae bacterium]|nr:type II toxin-antitoxin system VapC family toxin [Solirubrobacteraceae bacterium]